MTCPETFEATQLQEVVHKPSTVGPRVVFLKDGILAHLWEIYGGSYMSVHVLLNLLNKLRKMIKMRGLPSILSLFRNEFNKFNNSRARMIDSIYHITLRIP